MKNHGFEKGPPVIPARMRQKAAPMTQIADTDGRKWHTDEAQNCPQSSV
jgi:hypothetical protein